MLHRVAWQGGEERTHGGEKEARGRRSYNAIIQLRAHTVPVKESESGKERHSSGSSYLGLIN